MTLAIASNRSIFSKNQVFHVAVNTYVPIFRGLDAHSGRKLRTHTHTHTHTHAVTRDSHSDDNNKDYSVFEALKLNIGIIQRLRTYAKLLNMKHVR